MAQAFPQAYADLVKNTTALENHMHDMQDCEFTVQDGVLFMLQTRNGKRTGPAALQIAVDLEKEGLVTKEEAVLMVEPRHLDQLLVSISLFLVNLDFVYILENFFYSAQQVL